MNTPEQVIATGATATGGAFTVGLVAQALPVLQALSFIVGITVGVLTAVYTYRKLKALDPPDKPR